MRGYLQLAATQPIHLTMHPLNMLNLTEPEKGLKGLQSMRFPRFLNACGKVGPENVAKQIVVVGGCADANCQALRQSVEIYTVTSGSWENGKQGLFIKN